MLFIRNGKVLTMEGKEYPRASILIENGKIKGIGENLTPPDGAQIIEAEGKYVLPGFIDAHTHLGTAENSLRWEGNDTNEVTDPVTPHVRALDSVYAMDESFRESLEGGVTSVITSPGSANVIGGQTAAIKTGGSIRVDDLVIKAPHSMKCALGENPKNAYGQMKKTSPLTRMATAAIFRETLFKAAEYLEKKENSADDAKKPDFNMKYEALIPVLKRDIPVHIHAHRSDDIHTAIRIAKEFNLKAVILHCTDGHHVKEHLKEAGIPAVVGPTLTHKSKPEVKNKTFETVDILNKAGVLTAITTDHPVTPLQHLNVCAALCVQAGLNETEALKSITIYAAEIMGLADRIGSLKEGKDADIVVWDSNPILTTARAEAVVIDGKLLYTRE